MPEYQVKWDPEGETLSYDWMEIETIVQGVVGSLRRSTPWRIPERAESEIIGEIYLKLAEEYASQDRPDGEILRSYIWGLANKEALAWSRTHNRRFWRALAPIVPGACSEYVYERAYEDLEVEYALAHEGGHVKRFDKLWYIVRANLLAINGLRIAFCDYLAHGAAQDSGSGEDHDRPFRAIKPRLSPRH